MKIQALLQNFLFGLSAGFLTLLATQYLFFNKQIGQEDKASVHTFVATEKKCETRPINTEIDFIDDNRPRDPQQTEVKTSWGSLIFSTEGAALEKMVFKRQVDGADRSYVVFDAEKLGKENKGFLLAFNEKTPYFYDLVQAKDTDSTVDITYRARVEDGTVEKTFVVHKKENKIDLILQITPGQHAIEPRLFYPAPLLHTTVKEKETFAEAPVGISAVIIDSRNTFEKIAFEKLNEKQGWLEPRLFGADDRYFVHALVSDADLFASRAFFRIEGRSALSAVLEADPVSTPRTWKLSFYVGPKESSAMNAVDPRLDKVSDYWWPFSILARYFLYLFNVLYSYLNSYGLAIVAITILVKLLLFPFTYRSEEDMKKRVDMQKKLAYLKTRYKDDPQTLAREEAELIKKYGLPGLGGCLPLVLQGVVFVMLNKVISNSFELYKAPMLWIPDLSAKDPYYILPFLLCVSLVVHALIQPDAKRRFSGMAVAVLFGAFAANFSAGIALYVCVNVFLGAAQSQLVKYFKLAS